MRFVHAETWDEELPYVLLGLRAQPSEDTGLSRAEAVFGTLIVLPNEFLQGDVFLLIQLLKTLKKIFGCSCFFFAKAQFQFPAAGLAAR
jgi:hypothetical protein